MIEELQRIYSQGPDGSQVTDLIILAKNKN